jgi:hypothetical protein
LYPIHLYEKREGSGSGSIPLTNGSGSKKWFLSSRIYNPGSSSRIPDPDPYFLTIPDPGVKKAPDPGSGSTTLDPADTDPQQRKNASLFQVKTCNDHERKNSKKGGKVAQEF